MAAIVKIDGSGRLIIPKKFRDDLHLHPGTKLTIQLSGDKLILQAAVPSREAFKKKFVIPVIKSSKPGSPNPTNEQLDDLLFLS